MCHFGLGFGGSFFFGIFGWFLLLIVLSSELLSLPGLDTGTGFLQTVTHSLSLITKYVLYVRVYLMALPWFVLCESISFVM